MHYNFQNIYIYLYSNSAKKELIVSVSNHMYLYTYNSTIFAFIIQCSINGFSLAPLIESRLIAFMTTQIYVYIKFMCSAKNSNVLNRTLVCFNFFNFNLCIVKSKFIFFHRYYQFKRLTIIN
jgi:hypothetical protein